MKLNDFNVEIFELTGSAPMPESARSPALDLLTAGFKHAAIVVDNIDSMVAELSARGVSFVDEIREIPNSNGIKFIFFQDNNGILIELIQALS